MRNNICSLKIQIFSFFDCFSEILVNLFRQTLLHYCIIKNIFSKDLRYIDQFCTHLNHPPFYLRPRREDGSLCPAEHRENPHIAKKGHSNLYWNALVLVYVSQYNAAL